MKIISKEIPHKDRSEFLRGFLILIRKDEVICKYERNMAMIIGKYFGFEEKFCEEALDNLLENEYISDEPPVFSSPEIAEFFVKETFRIINQIHSLQQDEIHWLFKTMEINEIYKKTKEIGMTNF